MSFEDIFEQFSENAQSVVSEAVRLLVKIADNIINNPTNTKIRTLQKTNSLISNKILSVKGATECLKLMGFHETKDNFSLPQNVPLDKLHEVKDAILMWKDSVESSKSNDKIEKTTSSSTASKPTAKKSTVENQVQRAKIPISFNMSSASFFLNMESHFWNCMQYENIDLQCRAKSLIPLSRLVPAAQKRLRSAYQYSRKHEILAPNISLQDTMLLELLRWFKEEFFSWVDTLPCENCYGKTVCTSRSSDQLLLDEYNVDVIELHTCVRCNHVTLFPRYDDIHVLLDTRRGRCGEWANTFTLFCRAMSWDARFVVEDGDHVWTEVYSLAQQRWIHCDPCENVCDKPLMYESGWKKPISYVMAYSVEEVQDVTWRYTSDFKATLKRRTKCTEADLLAYMMGMRAKKQKKFSALRKAYLTRRVVLELIELMVEPKPDETAQGRISGSADWRLARGEISDTEFNSFTWKITNKYLIDNKVTFRYSTALDKYQLVSGSRHDSLAEVKKWNAGVFKCSDVFRKEEKDWKQVYLARKEGSAVGEISWKFELDTGNKSLDWAVFNFDHATYENGNVTFKIYLDSTCLLIADGAKSFTTRDFRGSKTITITATLSGGKGDVAWQHAQLFRQKSDSNEFPFSFTFTFK